MYERAALQEAYTAALIARSRSQPGVKRLFSAYHGALGSKGKYSGWVRARFSWSIKWQKCWAVVSDTPSSWSVSGGHGIHERLMYKFSSKQSLRGEVRFYESRRDAKNKPIAILGNVFAAYAVYPEKPFLVDSSTLIKVEGSLQVGPRADTGRRADQYKDAFVLLMPEDIPSVSSNSSSPTSSPVVGSSTSGTFASAPQARTRGTSSILSALSGNSQKPSTTGAFESMLTWLVAFYDAFNLYGRPEKLITDNSHRDSMIFAMPSSMEDAYLDVEEVFMSLAENGNLENNTYSSREWRQRMKDLTLNQLRQGRKVFNPAVLLKNTVAEVPVIRPPVPPHLRQPVDITGDPIRTESAPVVSFAEHPAEPSPPMRYPPPAAQRPPQGPPQGPRLQQPLPLPVPPQHQQGNPPLRQPQRESTSSNRLGFLRRKPSKPEPDRHSRSFSADVEHTHAALNRFSLNEDSEDDTAAEIFSRSGHSSYQSSPLRNSAIRLSTGESEEKAIQKQVHVDRPSLMKRMSSHRRGHSETRMAELHREADETRRGYGSDEESEKPRLARRVSSDEMLKVQHPVGGRSSRGSDDNGTQFNHTFDEKEPRSKMRNSESSSDHSETSGDPSQDTPRLETANTQSSPASSMESLPPAKQGSPVRGRRSVDERMYNAPVAPAEPSYNAPVFQGRPTPSLLLPVNGQPIPVHREPSPNRFTQQVPGPRTAPWAGVNAIPLGPSARVEDALQRNQDLLRPREHRPAPSPTAPTFDAAGQYRGPSPTTPKFPQPLGYPAQPPGPRPQQFPVPPMGSPYNVQNIPPRARPQGPYPPMDIRNDGPMMGQPPPGNRVPRRVVPPPQQDIRGNLVPPTAAAAARSAYSPNPHGRSPSPGQRPGYPQGPREIAS